MLAATEEVLDRGHPPLARLEETLQVLAGVDEPLRQDDARSVEEDGVGQLADLVGDTEGRRENVLEPPQTMLRHERSMLLTHTVAYEDDLQPAGLGTADRAQHRQERLADRAGGREAGEERAPAVGTGAAHVVRVPGPVLRPHDRTTLA